MLEFTFSLLYQLSSADADMDALVERLYLEGCTDALVGMGMPGYLRLDFTREAASKEEAIQSAMFDVSRAAPTAVLLDGD
jgi:hypothetical protein